MKYFTSLLFCFLLSSSLLCQQTFSSSNPDYIKYVKAGEVALGAEKYDSCLVYYKEAFKIKQTSVLSTLRAAACAYSINNQEVYQQYMTTAFDLDWDQTKGIFEGYKEFEYLKGTDFNNLIQTRWEKEAKSSGLDLDLMDEFAEIQRTDQEQRSYMREVQEKHGWGSPQLDSLWKIQTASDEANLARIEEIIAEHGYPGKTLVGSRYMSTAFLVIQHSNQEAQEKYLPLIKSAADREEVRWSSVALLIDRILLGKGKKQTYGSQISTDKETGEYYFSPIENPYQVDSIRNTVGLGTLQSYADHWEFTWDPEKHIERHNAVETKNEIEKKD